jgi:hypothetical protein
MECGGPVSTGLICKIEHVIVEEHFEDAAAIEEVRYWAVWDDGQYAWVTEENEPEVISESG